MWVSRTLRTRVASSLHPLCDSALPFCRPPPRRPCSSSAMPIRVLNVAEKNDAAKNIAALLSNGNSTRVSNRKIEVITFLSILSLPPPPTLQQREGFSKFNKIYEFRCRVEGHDCDMTMTSVSGHLLGLDFEERYRKWRTVDPVRLFDLPVHKHCPKNMEPIKVWIVCTYI